MIDFKYANECLSYNERTGHLFWKERPADHFKNEKTKEVWNNRFAGKRAGTLDFYGRITIKLKGKKHFAHRIAWLIFHGTQPEQEIDHIDGSKSNNKIINLRDVSAKENQKNRPRQRNNKSGFTGVYYYQGFWFASIKVNGKKKNLGKFKNKENAIKRRKKANIEFNFHKNHGR